MGDNIIRPSQRRRWGFTGTIDNIQLTDDKAVDAKDILSTSEQEEARGNGGGFPSEDEVTLEYLESLTKDQLFELAAAHEIELESKSSDKKDVVFGELKEYYEV